MTSPNRKPIRIIGVPMDLGAANRGVDMGPSAIRIAGLSHKLKRLGYDVVDLGNLSVPIAEVLQIADPKIKYLPEVAQVSEQMADRVETAAEEGAIPLILGGDQSISVGSIAGIASHYHKRNEKIGVIWFDAHGDMNTPETTPSGNIHGMPYAASMGMGVEALTHIKGFAPKVEGSHCALLGARSLDEGERENIRRSGLHVFTMRNIDERGIRSVVEEAINIASNGTAGIFVSLDMDFFDPIESPGVGTPVMGGATFREGHLAMEMIADTQRLIGLEVVEVNPVLDTHNRTAEFAVGLICSAFGQRIL